MAYEANFSVWFRSEERPRNDVEPDEFGFGRTKTEREPKVEMGEGEVKETLTLTLSSLPGTPFFVWSLTPVPCSLFRNLTKKLATQANLL